MVPHVVAEVLPAAPAAGAGLAGLLLLCVFLVCLGLSQAWKSTIGWLFTSLADLFDNIVILTKHPLGPVSSFLRSIDRNVTHALGAAALRAEAGAVWLFNFAWWNLQWVGKEIAELAEATERLFAAAPTVTQQQIRKWTAGAINSNLARIRAFVHTTEASLGLALHKVKTASAALTHATTVVIPHALGGIRGRVGRVERDATNLRKRVGKLEKSLAAAGAAALVVTALGRLGLKWLRCGNMRRVGNRICGVHPSWIDEFLAASVLIVGATSFEEFVKEAQDGYELGIEGLKLLIREL